MIMCEDHGRTRVLKLSDPARRNALSSEMQAALATAMAEAEVSPNVRAIVIAGAGGTFCSGGDIASMNAVADEAAARELFRTMNALVRMLVRGSKPVIAAVEGWAAGAGVGLALCADTIVAADGAYFVSGFERLSLVPDFGLSHTLPARIGAGRARNFILYGEPLAARDAERIGMVDLVVPTGDALPRALARAAHFETAAPLSVAHVRAAFAAGLDRALDLERDTQAALLQTRDHEEGRTAFLEKRPPRFFGV